MSQSHPIIVRSYVWAILAGHAVVFAFFFSTNVLLPLSAGIEPLCWPYFPSCGQFRFASPASLSPVLDCYALLIITGAALFNNVKAVRAVIVALNLLLFGVISLDYRLRANEFYMFFWLNGVYLLWPRRRWAVPLTLISFYFWAGRLKLNYEWASGAVLYSKLWFIPARFTTAACIYVIVLEMVMIWGLLSSRRLIRWLVFGQLVLFHVESLSQIRWFYPALMATMLAWFVMEDVIDTGGERPNLDLLFRGKAPNSAYALLVLFGVFQMLPLLYRGNSTLNGQGRLFALHMFEARQVCDVSTTLHYINREPIAINLKLDDLPPRMICDPIVYYSRVENICQSLMTGNGLLNADFRMRVKRTTDREFHTIIDEPAFCIPHHSYSMLFNNSWVK